MHEPLSTISELDPYRRDPPAMRAAGAGKRGYLRLGFEREAATADNRARRTLLRDWERRAPLIAQQALYFDEQLPEMACLYLLSAGGPYVDGDRYRMEFRLGAESEVHISTGAATKIASMRHNFAASEIKIRLDKKAYMEYLPEAVIPCRHSRLYSQTELCVDPTATLFFSECYLAGRSHHHGERFAYDLLSLSLQVRRPDQKDLFKEKILLQPAFGHPAQMGIMGSYEVFASALILTPEQNHEALCKTLSPLIGFGPKSAFGILHLPAKAGLLCRILASGSEIAKGQLRHLCSVVRQQIKGVPLPKEFPWR